MSRDMMVDIETLSSQPDAMVLSIGWCFFNLDNPEEPVHGKGYVVLDRKIQEGKRHIDSNTVKWWTEQSDAARVAAFNMDGGLYSDYKGFEVFYEALEGADTCWANGSDFDNVVLKSLGQVVAPELKWPYRKNRCYRTIKAIFGSSTDKIELEKLGLVGHNTLDDAVYQAEHMRLMLKRMEE